MKGHIVSFLHITAATLNIENPSLPAAGMLATHARQLENKKLPHNTHDKHRTQRLAVPAYK